MRWPLQKKNAMLKYAIYSYMPKRYLKHASFETQELDRMILDFKDGRKYATRWAVDTVLQTIGLMDFSSTIFACVPASCQRTTVRRYRRFAEELCRRCNAINAFDHITVKGHRRKKHLQPSMLSDDLLCNTSIDEAFFKGKKVVVFDDICTTGKSSQAFIECLENAGASVRMALFLAKTKRF